MTEVPFDPTLHLPLEREATRHFVDILQREQSALQQADIFGLDPLTQEKMHQLERLAQLANIRHTWLAAHGHSADHEGMERGLREYPGTDEVWKELLGLARTAMQMNKLNGLLIDRQMRYNQERLKAVQAAIQPVNLYGSDGQPRISRSARELGEG